jgi:hypothetical protein
MEVPKKQPAEQRTENPTIRMSTNNKERTVAAAKACGYAYYTEWIHDVTIQAVERVEAEAAAAKAATKKKAAKR